MGRLGKTHVQVGLVCAGLLLLTALGTAQRGGGSGNVASPIFTALDTNKDGSIARDEMRTTMEKWFTDADAAKSGSVTSEQLATALNAALPAPEPAAAAAPGRGAGGNAPAGPACGGRANLPTVGQTPCPDDVTKMMAALPANAPAKSLKPRKVLALGVASGFVHSSIPLASKTIEEMGKKTNAWTTTISYDAADVNAENLKQYDAIFLSSSTGCFLDKPGDPAETAKRRQALLDFVRSGKGVAGIHATGDSYHGRCPNDEPAAGGAGGRGGRGQNANAGAAPAPYTAFAGQFINQGDKNGDRALDKAEMTALSTLWFNRLDATKSGKVDLATFQQRLPGFVLNVANQGRDTQKGSWQDWDNMIGGFFKFHWVDPQPITVKIDDKTSPLTAMFKGQDFDVRDETYTFGMDTWSRENLHILTSINYDKMSEEDKLKESNPRADHDYGLSWIKREGQGRVFYHALGHSERIYAMPNVLQHILAGMQYTLGDLKADDSPSVKKK